MEIAQQISRARHMPPIARSLIALGFLQGTASQPMTPANLSLSQYSARGGAELADTVAGTARGTGHICARWSRLTASTFGSILSPQRNPRSFTQPLVIRVPDCRANVMRNRRF